MKDTRTKEQLESYRALQQERLDQTIEREWRRRVGENERQRLERRVQQIIGRQAS